MEMFCIQFFRLFILDNQLVIHLREKIVGTLLFPHFTSTRMTPKEEAKRSPDLSQIIWFHIQKTIFCYKAV